MKSDIKYIFNYIKYNTNNIKNKILIKSISKYNTNDYNSQTCCMKKLNDIQINSKTFELIAIGGSNNKILILNLLNFSVYQTNI